MNSLLYFFENETQQNNLQVKNTMTGEDVYLQGIRAKLLSKKKYALGNCCSELVTQKAERDYSSFVWIINVQGTGLYPTPTTTEI